MDVYIARQPIFDRNLKIYGYELLYRNNMTNAFSHMDDDQATSELIYNSFLVFGLDALTDGTKAFINFSKDLVNSDVPLMLPKESVVIEILERERATAPIIDACKKMRELGYTLALDDFSLDEDNSPLLEIVDIIKVEFPAIDIANQAKLIKKHKNKVKFLAEKIETREEYQIAKEIGYDYFQGYFFCKPAMINSKDIVSLNSNLFDIIAELNQTDPDFAKISDIFKSDLGLSYKLLKLVNSAYIGARYKIKSIQHALTFLGSKELYQWISLMLLKDLQTVENAELITQSLVRGKLMAYLASETNKGESCADYFFTGVFSELNTLLNKDMIDVLSGLPLPDNVKEALLGHNNEQRHFLDCVISYESAQWKQIGNQYPMNLIGSERFATRYIDALTWVNGLNY